MRSGVHVWCGGWKRKRRGFGVRRTRYFSLYILYRIVSLSILHLTRTHVHRCQEDSTIHFSVDVSRMGTACVTASQAGATNNTGSTISLSQVPLHHLLYHVLPLSSSLKDDGAILATLPTFDRVQRSHHGRQWLCTHADPIAAVERGRVWVSKPSTGSLSERSSSSSSRGDEECLLHLSAGGLEGGIGGEGKRSEFLTVYGPTREGVEASKGWYYQYLHSAACLRAERTRQSQCW